MSTYYRACPEFWIFAEWAFLLFGVDAGSCDFGGFYRVRGFCAFVYRVGRIAFLLRSILRGERAFYAAWCRGFSWAIFKRASTHRLCDKMLRPM